MVGPVPVVGQEPLGVLVPFEAGAGLGPVVVVVVAVPDLVEWLGGSSRWFGCICSNSASLRS